MSKWKNILILLLIPMGIFANGVEVGGIYYLLSDKTATVTYTGSQLSDVNRYAGRITIPEQIVVEGKTYQVTRIGANAFSTCNALQSVALPNSIEVLEEKCFQGSTALQSVHFGQNIQRIEAMAFSGCTALTSATLPKRLKSIGKAAFRDCRQLARLSLGDSLQYIDALAFNTCSELRRVNFPKTLVRIGDNAFSNCIHLESVMLPDQLQTLGEGAFRSCTNLNNVNMGSRLQAIPNFAFSECYDLSSITLGKNIQEIGNGAFQNCNKLTSIILPRELKSIGNSAFAKCQSLALITVEGCTPPEVGENTFMGVNPRLKITIRCNRPEAYKNAAGWSAFSNYSYTPSADNNVQEANNTTANGGNGSEPKTTGNAGNGTTGGTANGKAGTTNGTNAKNKKNNNYTLTIVCSNEHYGAVAGSGIYAPKSTITILAAARSGYRFTHWSDGETAAARDIVLTQDSTLTAYFTLDNRVETIILDSDLKKNDTTKQTGSDHTHKVHQGDNLYIIRGDKKYNVLGVPIQEKTNTK